MSDIAAAQARMNVRANSKLKRMAEYRPASKQQVGSDSKRVSLVFSLGGYCSMAAIHARDGLKVDSEIGDADHGSLKDCLT